MRELRNRRTKGHSLTSKEYLTPSAAANLENAQMPNPNTSVLVEFFPDSGAAVVYALVADVDAGPQATRPIVTTCTTPEQLWATIQAIKRPLAHIDLARAQRQLDKAKELMAKERMDIEQALAALNSEPDSTIELVANIGKVARKRARSNFNTDLVNLEDIDL